MTEPTPGARVEIGKQTVDRQNCFLKGNHMSGWGSHNNKVKLHNYRPEDSDIVEQWNNLSPWIHWSPSAQRLLHYSKHEPRSQELSQGCNVYNRCQQVRLWGQWMIDRCLLNLKGCSGKDFHGCRQSFWENGKILTAALTVANSTTALPFFLLDIITFKTSPY